MLQDILEKQPADLSWDDYQNLFGPYLPAGTYDEQRYYVPHFVEFLDQRPEHRLDLVAAWAGFSSLNWDFIVNDGAAEYILAVNRYLLRRMTQTFEVKHFDKDECRRMGWGLDYCDYISGTEFRSACERRVER